MKKCSSLFDLFRLVLVVLIGICCLNVNSVFAKDNIQGLLNPLEIVVLDDYAEKDTVPKEVAEQVIFELTGMKVSLADNSMNEVLKGYITALGYDYKLGSADAVKKTSAEFRLVKDAYKNDAVTRLELEAISEAALDVKPAVWSGTKIDPKLVISEETLAQKQFGAIYTDGIIEGSYGDGIKREEPLAKNEILVEGERYICKNSKGMTGQKKAFAYVEKNGKNYVVLFRSVPDIVISERTGHSGRELIRRGIPFAPGELTSPDDIYLKCTDGTIPTLQTEVMEKHKDGSIKWLSVAFMWDVEANKEYSFYFKFGKREATSSAMRVSSDGKNAEIKNEYIVAKIGETGIASLSVDGQTITGEKGIRLSVNDGKEPQYFNVNSIDVAATGPVYTQLRLTGSFSDINVSGDWFITIYQGDKRLYHEMKYTAVGDMTLNAQSIEVDFAEEYNNYRYASDAKTNNGIVTSVWYEVSSENGGSIVLSSKDVKRFEDAIQMGAHNGFVHSEESSVVTLSPIQHDVAYKWPDGVTRTVRMDMSFYDKKASDHEIDREAKWAFNPPAVTVSSERFVETGWIDDNSQSDAIVRTEELVRSLYGRLWGKYEAGKYPHRMQTDYPNRYILGGDYDRSGGEVEFNLWKSYMNTGDPVIFDLLSESAEFWVDFMIYRGENEVLLGANRYQTTDHNSVSFMTSMPFYGDLSGIYMTWCMTADPYYKECFKLGTDHWEMSTRKGGGFPNVSYWYDALGFNEQSTYRRSAQYRFCAQVRGLYMAYELFGDEKYFNAAKNIISFLSEIQNENGSFYEAYDYLTKEPNESETNDDGTRSISEKIYIMQYGGRMVMDFYNASGYEPALEIMEKLAEYLLTHLNEHGASWTPNPNDDIWHAASQRGLASDACAISFFTNLYEATGKDIYLEAMAKLFRCYIAAWNGGNMNGDMETGYTTFLKSSQTASRVFKDNKEKLQEMGYPDVVALVDSNTMQRDDLFMDYRTNVIPTRNRRHALNVFETKDGLVAYLYNCELKTWPDPTVPVFDTEFKADENATLWYGHDQVVNKDGVFVRHTIETFDNVMLMETDFSLLDFSGEIEAEITEYTSDSIKIRLKGEGTVVFSLEDGYFNVENGKKYTVKTDNNTRIVYAQDGAVMDTITLNGAETVIEIAR